MSDEKALIKVHPEGERETGEIQPPATGISLDTFAGKIQFRWAPDAAVSSLGQMVFFIEFLKISGLFEHWVRIARYSTPVRTRPRSGMCWGRFCYRCWRGTGAMRISARCEAMESIPSCWE